MKKILSLSLVTLLVLTAFSTGFESFALKAYATEGYVCTANYYFMNEDMSTYSLDKTEAQTIAVNEVFSPVVYDYKGFISPKQKRVVADKARIVNYFYDRETYTIEYFADGSDVVPESQDAVFGTEAKITKIRPEKDGYTFLGWTDKENSNIVKYQSGDTINCESNVFLYAVWKINTYIISFDSNGGTLCESVAYEYGSTYDELPLSEKSGYKFDGWYYDIELTQAVNIEDSVDSTGDKTLYAKWNERKITSVDLTTLPQNTEYFVGDTLTTTGLELLVSYDNGETETVASGYTVECDEFKNAGAFEVTVNYKGMSCRYSVNVSEVELSALKVTTLPKNLTYYAEDSLDTTGMVVEVTYNNGKTKIINEGYTAEYDFSVSGESQVTVIYSEYGVTVYDTFKVNVLEMPEVYSADISAEKDDVIAVPIYIKNNLGLMGYHINLTFDSNAFTPEYTEASELYKSGYFNDNIGTENDGTLSVVWTGTEAVAEDGLLFTVYFRVEDTMSGEYTISVSYTEDDTINDSYSEVKLSCTDFIVTVKNDDYVAIPKLYADDINTVAGGNVQLPVYIKNGENTSNLNIVLSYDENLVKPVSVNVNSGSASLISDSSTALISLENMQIASNDEQIVIVEFEVSNEAFGSYEILISADCALADTIKMEISSADNTSKSNVYADEIVVGSHLVTIPICISENKGVMGYKINVAYDNTALVLSSVSCGNDFLSGMFTYSETNGVISVVWNNTQNVSANSVLFTLNFERLENTELNTFLDISYSQADTFDESWQSVTLDCTDATIISNQINGDVNSDTFINLKDIVLLKRYVAEGYDVSINLYSADINKDGAINIIDIMLSERYLDGNFEDANRWFE